MIIVVRRDAKLIIMLMWANIRKKKAMVLLSLNPDTSFHLLSMHTTVIHSNKNKVYVEVPHLMKFSFLL